MNISSEEFIILYKALLYLAGACNIVYAASLLVRVVRGKFREFPTYRRSAAACASAMLVFGIPFFLHAAYSVRLIAPIVATIIGLTSFHIGALLFAYAYIVLLAPQSITARRKVANIVYVVASIFVYWGRAIYVFSVFLGIESDKSERFTWSDAPWWLYMPFLAHATYLCFRIYKLYIHQRSDSQTSEAQTDRLTRTIPTTVYLIIISAVGSMALYCTFPKNLFVYITLLVVAYFVFYNIFRTMTRFGRHLLTDATNGESSSHRWQRHMMGYNYVYHAMLLLLVMGIAYIFTDKHVYAEAHDDEHPFLNLTHHAYWDSPSFDDGQMLEFIMYLHTNLERKYFNALTELFNDTVRYERALQLQAEINKMEDMRCKGVVQLIALENIFTIMPKERYTMEYAQQNLNTLYQIAQGENAVPQQLFFTCWENVMSVYTQFHALDSVKYEADRMLAICRQQNLPCGIVLAHNALATYLSSVDRYEEAAAKQEVAIETYNNIYTKKYGSNWLEKDALNEDLLYAFNNMKSCNACYHAEAGDSLWFSEHHDELEELASEATRLSHPEIQGNLYYALATCNERWGDPKRYDFYMNLFRKLVDKVGDATEFGRQRQRQQYYTLLIRRALRSGHPDEALNCIDLMPDVFRTPTNRLYAETLMQLGRHSEAAECFKQAFDDREKQLSSHNLNILASMDTGVNEVDHQMQMMQARLQNQQTRLLYNSLLIFVLGIMLASLVYFLLRLRRLNERLSEAIDAKERASHVKDIFLENMTHEFHTPLNALYGFSQLMADTDYPIEEESVREMADQMVSASEHMIKLLDNIIHVTDKLSKLDRLEDVESVLKENDPEEPPKPPL